MRRLFIMSFACIVGMTVQAQPKLSTDSIDAVVAAMTLEEKATLLVGANQGTVWW